MMARSDVMHCDFTNKISILVTDEKYVHIQTIDCLIATFCLRYKVGCVPLARYSFET